MVFVWTIMSVFAAVSNVVANINNNQNNNNNNDNNINLNIVSTQNTQISSNVNNANTISIMLPPPIPVLAGGRKLGMVSNKTSIITIFGHNSQEIFKQLFPCKNLMFCTKKLKINNIQDQFLF